MKKLYESPEIQVVNLTTLAQIALIEDRDDERYLRSSDSLGGSTFIDDDRG